MDKAHLMLAVALLAPMAWCGGDEDKEVVVVPTTLTSMRERPDAFKHVTVRFTVQFNGLGKVSNPFFTRFVPTDYVNFYGWASEQPIWRKEAYDDLFGMLFLSKESPMLSDLYKLRVYDRIEVEGIVRNTFQNAPWIEVLAFKPISGKVTTATLAHLYRGEDLMKKRQWDLAIRELSLAPAQSAPDEVRSSVHKNLGICYLRQGEVANAVSHLQTAATMTPGGDPECERLLEQAQTRPEKELDRTVRETKEPVRDTQRPLWEAFESVQPAPTRPNPNPAPGGAANEETGKPQQGTTPR